METFLAGLRVVVSLAVVVALLWVLQRRLTRGSRASGAAKPVRIVTKQAISPKASVVIIDVEGTRLLLGVTEHAVSVLQTTDAPAPEEAVAALETAAEPSSATAFAKTMSSVTGPKTAAAFTGNGQAGGALAGSILSPATWKQLASVFRQGR